MNAIGKTRQTRIVEEGAFLELVRTTGLLARLDRPVQDAFRAQLGHLGEKRLNELSELLMACCERLA